MSSAKQRVIPVALGDRSYDVVVGSGLLADAGRALLPFAPRRRAIVVTDSTVAGLHLEALGRSLDAAGITWCAIVLAPGEQTKSFAGLEALCGELLDTEIERRDLIVAFGGGVIGDLAGFAAGIIKRGVDFVQIPTTLLAQVDSSVGGKTAIDTPVGKNLVGLFYQPRLVLADLDVLGTLPVRQLKAGYAEIVKYGLIDDPDFFAWCEANAMKVLTGDPGALAHAVGVSVAAKARIVGVDERESGARALLNLGHTFAHGLEASAGFDTALLHGEAVGAGMNLAFRLSARMGLCDPAEADRVTRHLSAVGFELDLRQLAGGPFNADDLMTHMAQDKKNRDGKLTFILTRGIGGAFVQNGVDPDPVRALLADELAGR
jgi:3-dehydroquinate synthase